jgi:hypothetical protein
MPLATILETLKPQQTLDKWLFNDANPWAAQFTLNLTIEEKSSLNPGVSFNEPLANGITTFPGKANTVTSPQSFAIGLGGILSSDATRTEKVTFTYKVNDLREKYYEENPDAIDIYI